MPRWLVWSFIGLGIGVLKIPFFVVTLGTLSIYQSIALLTTKGETVSLFSFPTFNQVQTLINGNALHYYQAELGWTLEDNHLINRAIEAVGGERYKTYRIYEKSLA